MSSYAEFNPGGPGIPFKETLTLTEGIYEGRRSRTQKTGGGQGSWVLELGAKSSIVGLNARQRGGGTQR